MPLSFASQAGGSLTLMGTAVNFVAKEVFESSGYYIAFFTLTLGGFIVAVFSAVYCALLAPRLLVDSSGPGTAGRQQSAKAGFTILLRVSSPSPLAGTKLLDAGLHRIPGVQEICELIRGEDGSGNEEQTPSVELQALASASSDGTIAAEGPRRTVHRGWSEIGSLELEEGDLLKVLCTASAVAALRRVKGLELSNEDEAQKLGGKRRSRSLCEAAVHENIVGSEVDARRWKTELRCAVLAVKSDRGEKCRITFNSYSLQPGDILLLEAFQDMVGSDIWLEHFGVVRVVPDSAPPRTGQKADFLRAIFIVIGLVVVISLASSGSKRLSLPLLAVIFLCGIIAVKGLKMEEAYGEVNGKVLLTIVGALVLGKAMEASCLANCVGVLLAHLAGQLGDTAVRACIYLATVGLGQFLNSSSNVAIMGQVAISIAESTGIPIGEVALIVTYAASACFMAPFGYQTNTLVMAAAGYDWADFIRFGGPMQAMHMGLVLFIAPWCAKVSPQAPPPV